MRIGINTRNLIPNKMEGFGHYTYEIVSRLITAHPEHEFILFFDRPIDPSFIFGPNSKGIVLSPPTRHPILYFVWFELKLPRALKKLKIDVFFSPDGYCSLSTKIPQVGVIHDINFEHNPKDLPKFVGAYLRFYFPKFAKKAKHIITVSSYSKADIVRTYDIDSDGISVIPNSSNEVFVPTSQLAQATVKAQWTKGKDFFLFVGSLHPRKNVQRLLDAFSILATEDKNVQLVIVGAKMWRSTHLNIPLSVQEQVVFTGHIPLDELAAITASAMALVYVPYFEGFGIPLVESMKCGIPILAANTTSLPEVAGNAAIYCDPFDTNQIAEGMRKLQKDEALRRELSLNGLKRGKLFSWETSAKAVWEIIEATEKSKVG